MLRLMATASVGDDVYRQDRATNALQDRIASLAGKEAALFCVSGTMTNREPQFSCLEIESENRNSGRKHVFPDLSRMIRLHCMTQSSLSARTSPNLPTPSSATPEPTYSKLTLAQQASKRKGEITDKYCAVPELQSI